MNIDASHSRFCNLERVAPNVSDNLPPKVCRLCPLLTIMITEIGKKKALSAMTGTIKYKDSLKCVQTARVHHMVDEGKGRRMATLNERSVVYDLNRRLRWIFL